MDQEAVRARFGIRTGALVVLLLAALVVAILVTIGSNTGSSVSIAPSASPGIGQSRSPIFIHVLGAVTTPGLYELREGDRTVDAIAAAGGFAATADQTQQNLARLLSDGEQLYVPVIGEAPATGTSTTGGKVDINTADAALLETLPRVGPAMAGRILAWREANGRFSAIEDLMSVTGIGEKTFEGLRDLVTV